MPTRPLMLLSLLLLAVMTGCPHAFGKGGTLDMALRKDMQEERRSRRLEFPCDMPHEKWLVLCSAVDDQGRTISPDCPKNCRLK